MSKVWIERTLFVLAIMLVAGSALAAKPAGSVSPDDGRAVLERVRPLAEQGNPNAQYNLGVIYDRGYGVERNYDKARTWYKKAAAQDYAKAAHNLGVMYQKGHGVPANDERAAQWFKKAAKLGEPAAQNNLAVMYAEGIGVERNLPLAVVWMARAARAGNDSAIENLPRIVAEFPKTTIDGNNVNVRSNPTTESAVLEQSDSGTKVILLQERGQWAQVLLPSDYVVGWVSGSLLTHDDQMASTVAEDTARQADKAANDATDASGKDEASSQSQKIVGTDTLNVRDEPSRQATVLFQLPRGAHVIVVKSQHDWAYIKLDDGRHGWVASYLLVGA